MDFTVYQLDSGEIVARYKRGSEEEVIDLLAPGEAVIEGWFLPDQHYIAAGGEPVAKPARPSDLHEWDAINRVWQDNSAARIQEVRAEAINKVNASVGEVRSRFVTVIAFQETTYADKEREAAAYVTDPDPDLDSYPYISKEIGITATTAYEVAQLYLNRAHMLRVQNAALEEVRLGAVKAIEEAMDVLQINSAMDTFSIQIQSMV